MAISPGWPIVEAGMWLYRKHYNQTPVQGQNASWWLRWIGEVWTSPQTADLRRELGAEQHPYFYAFNMIAPRANELVIAEERLPGHKQPEPDYSTHFIGKDALGWTLNSSDLPPLYARVFSWVVTQVRMGRLGSRYLDVALYEMIQKGKEKAALPIWQPPTGGGYPTDEEQAVWFSFMRKTGYTDVQRSLTSAIMSELQSKKRDNQRWIGILDTADKVVGWVSLTEPVRMLMQKTDELVAKYREAKQSIRASRATLAEVEGLDPAYGAELDLLERSINDEARPAFRLLNPMGMWDAEEPTQLGALPVMVIYGGAALLALGVVSVSLVSITSMITKAQRTSASIAGDAQNILRQRIEVSSNTFDREAASLRNQLLLGQITQAQYDQRLLDINKRRQDALARLQREAAQVQRNAPTGSIFGTLGLGAVLAGVAIGGFVFRRKIFGSPRRAYGY